MSSQIKNQACISRPSNGGLFAFLRIRALLGCIFEVDQNLRLVLETQAGTYSGNNICTNLPTDQQQCYSGSALKAVTRHFGALRPFVAKKIWPLARGSDT